MISRIATKLENKVSVELNQQKQIFWQNRITFPTYIVYCTLDKKSIEIIIER